MKKYIGLIILIYIVISTISVYAVTNFEVNIQADKTDIKAGDIIQISVDFNNFTPEEPGINVALLNMEYDDSVFEQLQPEDIVVYGQWENGGYNASNERIILESMTFVNQNHNVMKINLKVKDDVSNISTTEFKITNIETSDGMNDIYPEDVSIGFDIQSDTTNYIIWIIAIVVLIAMPVIIMIVLKTKAKTKNKTEN